MKQLLALISVAALSIGVARADDSRHTCTIRVIHATNPITGPADATSGAPKLDPRIDLLRAHLLRPPFTAWREFKLLDAKTLELESNAPSSFTLPNGKVVTLTFLEHLPDLGKKRHRVRVQLEISGTHTSSNGNTSASSLKTVFVVEEGGLVLQAGQPHRHGMLVVGTSCTEAGH